MPVVCAEDFNNYKSLVINNEISGKVSTVETGSGAVVEYVKADMLLFPRETFQQAILKQGIASDPEHDSLSMDETITLKWADNFGSKANFKVSTVLEIKNDFTKIFKTIDFPIQGLSPDLEKYTYETNHMDINEKIRDKANEVVAGETDLFIAVSNVGEWVRTNIEYDLNTLTAEADQRASWVFNNRKGVCDEITNLFIAMLRSVNVPARFVSGIVYSNVEEGFGNHGWAEVYFPGYGWVPFDVTFGQYGWVDPTHINLGDSYDSGVPSVEYNWKSKNVEFKAEPLEFKTEVTDRKGSLSPYVSMEIRPLKDKVGFGSYVPVEVTVINLGDFYVPSMIYITKSPQLINNNVKYLVLKPKEKKHLYWMIKIPSDLEEEYIYTSELGVKNNFGSKAENIIKYSNSFDVYSKEWAEKTVERLTKRESKFFFSDLDLKCKPDKDSYYPNENAKILCSIFNKGNVKLENINVCLLDGCKMVSLGIGERGNVEFDKATIKSGVVVVSVENNDMVRYTDVKIDVVEIPSVQVLEVKPDTISYYVEDVLVVAFFTESPAYNVKVDIGGLGLAEWDALVDKKFLKVPFKGSDLSDNVVKIKMEYDDALNKTYSDEVVVPIKITDVPAYIEVWNWFKNLFGA